ncbi:hypothetical protein [Nocardia asiatica]|uniref:hypothetical protein n=1 Tax=Nocardia asiatica TaxID=209252 RepID=UPI002453DF51|nr:hypothetical protein [Nocardia asiatica]
MGVVDVAGVAVLLQCLGGVETVVDTAAGVTDQIARLLGEDVGSVAVLAVVDVAQHQLGSRSGRVSTSPEAGLFTQQNPGRSLKDPRTIRFTGARCTVLCRAWCDFIVVVGGNVLY